MNKLRLIVADDNPSVVRQLVSMLTAEFDVVTTAENGQVALECIRQHMPDVVVLDITMPVLNGIEVTRELQKLAPAPVVVICSAETEPEIVQAAQRAGAVGYVFKIHLVRDLIAAVKAAARGESFVSSCLASAGSGESVLPLR